MTSLHGVYELPGVLPGLTIIEVQAYGCYRHLDTILVGKSGADTVINVAMTSVLPVDAIIKEEMTAQEGSDLLGYRDSLHHLKERMQVLRVTIDSMWLTPGLNQLMADIRFTNLCELPLYLLNNFPPCLESLEAIFVRESGEQVRPLHVIDCIGEKTSYRDEDIFVVAPRATTHWKARLEPPDITEGETYRVRLRYHHVSRGYVFLDQYVPKTTIRVELQALEGSFLSENEYRLLYPHIR